MLFSYYIGSPRKVCLLHHSTWFGFSTWCDDILSNVRIQQFVKSAKTFFFPFFLFENSSIFLSPPLLDLCKFYWKFSHAFLVRRRERSLLCITFQKLRKEKNVLQPDGCIPWFLQNAVYFLSQSPFSNPRWNAADLFRNPSSRSSDLDLYRNQFIGKTTWNCICIISLGETIWICIEIQFIG